MRVLRFNAVRPGTKALGVLGVALLTMTGCASLGTAQGGTASGGGPPHIAPLNTPVANPAPPSPPPFASQGNDALPRMIIPATGGPPVLGIPLGGGIFLPATGGLPVVGIPLEP